MKKGVHTRLAANISLCKKWAASLRMGFQWAAYLKDSLHNIRIVTWLKADLRSVLMICFYAVFMMAAFILAESFGISAFAAGDLPRLVDEADLLSDEEEMKLHKMLDEISVRQQTDIVVVTVDSLGGASPVEYADDFYDSHGYGFGDDKDGILFLISMEERDWYVSTTGFGITAVTDAGLEYMSDNFLDDLSDGEYAAAFTAFAGLCDDFITQARSGEPYDAGHLPKPPFRFVINFFITFGIGFLIALIAVSTMKGRLKAVRCQSAADCYVKSGSLQITRSNDLFLYRHIDRRERPKDNVSSSIGGSSTHTSSSGRTHGGGGGKF